MKNSDRGGIQTDKTVLEFILDSSDKRYITQLIFKGLSHHHWHTRIVAVMQDVLVDKLWEIGQFSKCSLEDSNIVFLPYKMNLNHENKYDLACLTPICTRHMDLMNSIVYAQAPSKDDFIKKIKARLKVQA